MHYTIIAYRWGWTNAHHYLVASCEDPDRACDIAQEECSDRGGKYGVEVLEWVDETTPRLHAYYPSAYGEDALHKNERIDMFEGIGHDVHSAVTTLTVWSPPEKPTGTNVPHAVEPAAWLVDIVREREQRCRFMNALVEDNEQRRAAALGPRSKEDTEQWVAEVTERIRKEIDNTLAKGPEYQAKALASHEERLAACTSATAPATATTLTGDPAGSGEASTPVAAAP